MERASRDRGRYTVTQLPTYLFSDPFLWNSSRYVVTRPEYVSWRDVAEATEHAVEAAVDDVVEGVYRASIL